MKELIQRLVESYGPSGYETAVADTIREMVTPYADEITVDALGSVLVWKKGSSGRTIMFSAHTDEIGIVTTHIDENGFLRFSNVGGLDPQTLVGNRVRFANGTIGVIGREKGSLKDLAIDKMFVDMGAENQSEAKKLVQVGDFGIIHREFADLGQRMAAKSMDDRIGCAVLVETIKQVGSKSPHNLCFVFSSQEEVGLRGARTAAYAVNPDLGIAVDVTRTGDTPEASRMDVSLGGGAAIKIKDSSLITHPKVRALMTELAVKNEINHQFEVLERGGTDAGVIHITHEGVPSGTISIPCRYVHSASEMVDIRDVQACVQLASAICQSELTEFPAR